MKAYLIVISFVFLIIFGIQPVRQVITVFSSNDISQTLVIDAGHGGFDGGAVSSNGITEQDINLSISKMVYYLSFFFGQNAVMTRADSNALDYNENLSVKENKIADIHARENITKNTKNPIFMSIHLNKFEQPQYFGAQVFYSKNNEKSKYFAQSIQSSFLEGIKNKNIRTAKPAPQTVYLMKALKCPAIIVECGFLSNPQEEQLLHSQNYQKRLAVCIFSGYQNYLYGENNETENSLSMR